MDRGDFQIAIIGGSLQGIETAYLAAKAGWTTLMIDRKAQPPARDLADRFVCADVEEADDLEKLLAKVDLIVPALEDARALDHLHRLSGAIGVPLAHDPDAYAVSSSKLASDALFRRFGIPAPSPWPGCSFPVICKPDAGSGSQGVHLCQDGRELNAFLDRHGDRSGWVIQEFLDGPAYSIEMIGSGNAPDLGLITDLHMDADYDCKRVTAPTRLPDALQTRFLQIARKLGEILSLRGIMDVEVVLHEGMLKVLEIDARFPSQTPTAVYWSSGVNLLERLAWKELGRQEPPVPFPERFRGVVYEHLLVNGETGRIVGEHALKSAGPVKIIPNFFGAVEAVSDYQPGASRWLATLIYLGGTQDDAWLSRCRGISEIRHRFGLKSIIDQAPIHAGRRIP